MLAAIGKKPRWALPVKDRRHSRRLEEAPLKGAIRLQIFFLFKNVLIGTLSYSYFLNSLLQYLHRFSNLANVIPTFSHASVSSLLDSS
jgi:cellulose synthase/poly-beta-1,6-N-acetylglucosamine synthase-like glycosyltransferase